MPTVIEIVADHLRSIGADGLVAPSECGCELSDLAPCGSLGSGECLPGWKGLMAGAEGPTDWAMYSTREAAEASKKEGNAP